MDSSGLSQIGHLASLEIVLVKEVSAISVRFSTKKKFISILFLYFFTSNYLLVNPTPTFMLGQGFDDNYKIIY